MSAYFVDKIVIDAIVSFAVRNRLYARLTKGGECVAVDGRSATHFGKMLWRTNELSILARYTSAPAEERASMREAVESYEWTPYVVPAPVALGCAENLAYQACEIAKWEASRCQLFCLKIQARASKEMIENRDSHGRPVHIHDRNIPWGLSDSNHGLSPADASHFCP